jgi:hypothetical protein
MFNNLINSGNVHFHVSFFQGYNYRTGFTEPTGPTGPINVSEPTEPTEPTGPTGPINVSEPTEPTGPTGQTGFTGRTVEESTPRSPLTLRNINDSEESFSKEQVKMMSFNDFSRRYRELTNVTVLHCKHCRDSKDINHFMRQLYKRCCLTGLNKDSKVKTCDYWNLSCNAQRNPSNNLFMREIKKLAKEMILTPEEIQNKIDLPSLSRNQIEQRVTLLTEQNRDIFINKWNELVEQRYLSIRNDAGINNPSSRKYGKLNIL